MKEEHLIKKLKSGNESALYCIIEQYTPYVSYIVENICGQAIRNEDKEEIICGDITNRLIPKNIFL